MGPTESMGLFAAEKLVHGPVLINNFQYMIPNCDGSFCMLTTEYVQGSRSLTLSMVLVRNASSLREEIKLRYGIHHVLTKLLTACSSTLYFEGCTECTAANQSKRDLDG